MTGQYKVISDNLGEYSVVSKDNVIVATEIQHRITAETFCEELNILAEENEQLKQSYKEFEDECQSTFNAMNRKQNDLYRKNFKLKEENEQLKQQLKTKYIVNKQYEELQKLKDENKELKKELQDCTKKAKEEIRKQREENAIRWTNIGR